MGCFLTFVAACWKYGNKWQNAGPWVGPDGKLQALLQLTSMLNRGPKNDSIKEHKRWAVRVIRIRARAGLIQKEVQFTCNLQTGLLIVNWDRKILDDQVKAAHDAMLAEEYRIIEESEDVAAQELASDRDRLSRKREQIVLGKGLGYDGLEDENGKELSTDQEVVEAVDRIWSKEAEELGNGAEGIEEEKLWQQFTEGLKNKRVQRDVQFMPGEKDFVKVSKVRRRTSCGTDGLSYQLINCFPSSVHGTGFIRYLHWALAGIHATVYPR